MGMAGCAEGAGRAGCAEGAGWAGCAEGAGRVGCAERRRPRLRRGLGWVGCSLGLCSLSLLEMVCRGFLEVKIFLKGAFGGAFGARPSASLPIDFPTFHTRC